MHDAQNLERADDAVSSRGEIAEDEVTALFAAEIEFFLGHRFNHIAIADFCPHHFSTLRGERFVQAKIAHDGGHNRVLRQPTGA